MTKLQAYHLNCNWTYDLVTLIIKRVISSDTLNYSVWDIEITNTLLNMQGITYGRIRANRLPLKSYQTALNNWLETPNELNNHIKQILNRKGLIAAHTHPYKPKKAYQAIKQLLNQLIGDVKQDKFRVFNPYEYDIPKPDDLI